MSTSKMATDSKNLGSNSTPMNLQVDSSNLPIFWHSNPRLWFKQAEIIMTSARYTTDDTKFNHIVKHLNESQCNLVSDVILNPPENQKYETLKMSLIKRTEDS
ncbi:MAG TPA: hypothetical protein DDZ41_02250, partial [Flavobacterium sp.]|nr:hypothetical protein [Flavobacterium sp.]